MAEVSGIKLGNLSEKNNNLSLDFNSSNKSVSTNVSNINSSEVEEVNLNGETGNKFIEKEYSYIDSSGSSQVISSSELKSILSDSDFSIDNYDIGKIAALQHYYYENFEDLSLFERENYFNIINSCSDYYNYDRKFDSMFLDSNAFDAFYSYLDGCPDGSDKFYQFQKLHDLYIDVVNSGELIPDDIFSKLSAFNSGYEKMLSEINHLDINFSSYPSYGVNQNAIQRVLIGGLNTPEYYRLHNIVKKYFPDYTDKQVYAFLSKLDGGDGIGLCTYAVLANYILQLDEKVDFDFGYGLYTKNSDGTVNINSAELLVDLFCFYNQDNYNFSNRFLDGSYWFESHSINSGSTYAIDGNSSTLNEELLSGFLEQHGYGQDCFQFDSKDLLKWYPSSVMDDSLKDEIRNAVIDELSKGNLVHMDYFKNHSDEASLKYYSENGDYYLSFMGSNDDYSGHVLTITGINEDGDLIVSSWGGIMDDYHFKVLRLDELTGLYFSISSEESKYNKDFTKTVSNDFDENAFG